MKPKTPVLQFGPFEFDPAQRQLRRGEERIVLPTALNKLLLLLASRPGDLVTREEIAEALWEEQNAVDVVGGINTAIKRLRNQIGDNNGHGIFIETVVGAGYRFAAPVSVAESPPALPAPAEAVAPVAATLAPRRRLLWPALAAGLVLAAGAGAWVVHSSQVAGKAADTIEKPFLLHSHPVTFDEAEDRLTAQAISPSGAYLAYSDRGGITLRTLATGEDRLLDAPRSLPIEHIAWTPDERSLLVSGTFATAAGLAAPEQSRPHTWRVALNGEPSQMLLDDADFATVSPTGGRIALLRSHQTEVWIAGPNGDAPHQLLKAPYSDTFTALLWAPAGNRIVVDRFHPGLPALAGADLNARDSHPETPGNPDDGSTYESYSVSNGALLSSRDSLRFDSAVLLPDGNLIYPVNSPSQEARLAIVKTDPATGTVLAAERLIPSHQFWSYSAYRVAQLSASADARTFSAVLDRTSMEVYTADLATSQPDFPPVLEHSARLTRHTGTAYPTAWSPDGSEVVFDNGVAGPISLAAQPLDGSRTQTLAESKSDLSKFAQGQFSPDGRWLLFLNLAMDSSRVQSIERIPAKGGTPQIVPTSGQIEEFHCSSSSSGRCVLREVEGKKHLIYYALDPVLGIGAELVRTAWEPNLLGDWTLSPDGTTVAMARHDSTHPSIQLVSLVSVPSTQREKVSIKEIQVAGFGTTLGSHWSADGKSFFVETYTGTNYDLVWVTLDGHASLLSQSPDLIWAIPSHDGKKIAFPARSPLNSNVWIGTAQPATPR